MASIATLLETLPSGVTKDVGDYLSIRDYINFVNISKGMDADYDADYEEMKPIWIERATTTIKNKLKDMGWTQPLFNGLKQSGAVIAGSFPLQCLLEEYWEESDVDIFCGREEEFHMKQTKFLTTLFDMSPKIGELLGLHGFDKQYRKYCTKCSIPHYFFDPMTGQPIETEGCDGSTFLTTRPIHIGNYITYLEEQNYSPIRVILIILCHLEKIYKKHFSMCSRTITQPEYLEAVNLLKRKYPEHSDYFIQGMKPRDIIGKIVYNNQKGYADINEKFFVQNLLIGDIHHQIITYEAMTPPEIVDSFDYEFCKVYFDGSTIHVKNWKSILTRTSKIIGRSRSSRRSKYEARGFIITDGNVDRDEHDTHKDLDNNVIDDDANDP